MNDDNPRLLLGELASGLNKAVIKEHKILQDELKQISSVLRDAVGILEESYRCISEQIVRQSDLARSLIDKGNTKNESETSAKLTELMSDINRQISKATRSLQFEDILQQLTAHSLARAEKMQHLFVKLGEKLDRLNTENIDNHKVVLQIINEMQKDVNEFCITVEKENPVKQHSMNEGKIELF